MGEFLKEVINFKEQKDQYTQTEQLAIQESLVKKARKILGKASNAFIDAIINING